MIAYFLWLIASVFFIFLGIRAILSKKETAFGFWANAEMFPVNNVKAYNRAVGILWCVFGFIFALLGLPLLAGQNSPYIIISIIGAMLEVIITIVIYVKIIEKKYRQK